MTSEVISAAVGSEMTSEVISLRGAAAAFGLAAFLTLVIGWPVIRSPTELIYGHEIAGRHYDAYTVMRQFGDSATAGLTAQPVTDRFGWALARVIPAIAAYNIVVLLTFPLTAAAAYLLARYLIDSHAAALVAGLLFAFAPLRLAHAAYHPHIVQTHWLALYLLALFALIDRPTWLRSIAVAAAAAVLTLSNYYGGLIGAVITPVAIGAYGMVRSRKSLVIPVVVVALIGTAAVVAIVSSTTFLRDRAAVAFDISDVARFSARWWAYFIPPIDHPITGVWAGRILARDNEPTAIVEEQVSMSYGAMTLAAIAIVTAVGRWRHPTWRPILALAAIAVSAWFVSIGPPSGSCTTNGWAPACLLYRVVPMFRSYARFAFVVHLAVAICAGAGVAILGRVPAGRAAAAAMLTIACVEYLPLPWRVHDVLPTAGHRWIMRQSTAGPLFDCVLFDVSLGTMTSLMRQPIQYLSPAQPTCADRRIGNKLAIAGYRYLVARRGLSASEPPLSAAKLSMVAEFPDSKVFALTQRHPDVAVVVTDGFYSHEHEGARWWQWMTSEGRWTVESRLNPPAARVSLQLQLQTVGEPRSVALQLDGQPAGLVQVNVTPETFTLGPWELGSGQHALTFVASGTPYRPSDHGSADNRPLTVMFISDERWIR